MFVVGTKLARENEAFRAMLPNLMQTHRGQYVAIHNGQVIASGTDELAVIREAFSKVGVQELLVTQVTTDPPRVVHLAGTPIGTPEIG